MRKIGVLGAGSLVATLRRKRDETYCIEITRDDGETHLRPSDLKHLLKLGELIAHAVLDDGWSSDQEKEEIRAIYKQLSRLLAS